MHPDYLRADRWTSEIIGSAIEVHRDKGAGLLEEIYKKCLWHELGLRQIPVARELAVPIRYKGYEFEQPLRLDLYVDQCLIVEAKAVEKILPIHVAQLLSYMRLLNAPIGLLFNFHEIVLRDGLRRLVLKGADQA
jgi:GxxExxY protein